MDKPSRDNPVSNPARVVSALIAVTVLALWGAAGFYRSSAALTGARRDPYRLAALEERLREPARLMPDGALVGYLSDVPFEDALGSAAFFGTQYVLAPRVLVEADRTAEPEWILGAFAGATGYDALARSRGWTLVRDFGNGLVLFRRRAE